MSGVRAVEGRGDELCKATRFSAQSPVPVVAMPVPVAAAVSLLLEHRCCGRSRAGRPHRLQSRARRSAAHGRGHRLDLLDQRAEHRIALVHLPVEVRELLVLPGTQPEVIRAI